MASALSEESRSETTSNSTSDDRHFMTKEERDEIASTLGIPEEDVSLEKFRVSRRRMEHLMYGHALEPSLPGVDTPLHAVQFFDEIMRDTNTVISWPTKLKRNATSRKDPYIKIHGQSRNISEARIRVLEGLDAEVRKVTLKIDVSYTDHSHIIGRGGNTIKEVMFRSKCHVHFPDCNRSNQHEKSNMVSIAGEVDRVEIARASVRELVPLVFAFDLPVLGALFMPMEEQNPHISALKEKYNVQVFFRTKQKLNSTLVSVKGNRAEYVKVKEATEKLIVLLRAPHSEQVQIHGSIEISPYHHATVRGKDNCNLNLIKASTGTQITFADLQDPNIPAIKRSNVTITGNCINSVYLALQFVIGSLPVTFSFELPETLVNTAQLRDVSERYDIQVASKLRTKSRIYSFVIRGLERNIANIYEAYRELTNYEAPEFTVEIPSTYVLPGALSYNEAIKKWEDPTLSPSPFSLGASPLSVSPVMRPLLSSAMISPPPPGMSTPIANNYCRYYHGHHKHGFNLQNHPGLQQPYSLWSHPFLPSAGQSTHQTAGENIGRYSRSTSSLRDFSIHSPTAGSFISSPGQSPIASPRTASPPSTLNLLSTMKDRPRPSKLQIPTPAWAGFELSNSSPPTSFKRSSDHVTQSEDGDIWRALSAASSKLNETSSNICEAVDSSGIDTVASAPYPCDLQTLLGSVGLEKYYEHFRSHEATDLEIFLSLDEDDLVKIGVNALGARKKLLMLITEFNSWFIRFRSTPGAERKKLRKELWWPEP